MDYQVGLRNYWYGRTVNQQEQYHSESMFLLHIDTKITYKLLNPRPSKCQKRKGCQVAGDLSSDLLYL